MIGKILVIDDDRALLRALRIGLSARNYQLSVATGGQEGLSKVALEEPDVVVLDLGLPDMDGLEVCRRLRQWSGVPVIVLSALADEDRKVAALDGGADDYITKPFGMAELEARVRLALRHGKRSHAGEEPTNLRVGELVIDLPTRRVQIHGEEVDLTGREFDLLAYLARHAGKVCTHRVILQDVWGPGYGSETNYLRVYANRIRRKLGDEKGQILRTNPGIGYQLVPQE